MGRKPLFVPIEGSTKRRNKVDPKILDKIWMERAGVRAPILLVLDKDETMQEEIDRDVKLFGEERIHYLNRREIENYMLEPKAILKLLRDKAEKYSREKHVVDTLTRMTEDHILEKISELVEQGNLRHKVRILKFLGNFYPRHFVSYGDVSGLIEQYRGRRDDYIVKDLRLRFYEKVSEQPEEEILKILEKVDETLDKEWDARKLFLCPGKDLFALINRWTEEEFQITFSPKDVIHYLDHIDDDIVQLVNKILVI